MLSIVVAYGRNRVIGVDGTLPWHLPSDMAFFKALTTGHPVIMGRRTYESIPAKFRPLPGRRNLVLSRDPAYTADGAEVFASVHKAIAAATIGEPGADASSATGEAFLIGGGQAYADALASVDRVYATEVDLDPDGDTFFPELGDDWQVVEEHDRVVEDDGSAFTIRVYDRIPGR